MLSLVRIGRIGKDILPIFGQPGAKKKPQRARTEFSPTEVKGSSVMLLNVREDDSETSDSGLSRQKTALSDEL